MNSGLALFLAFSIGIVAGLRSMTAPAIVAWAVHLGDQSFRLSPGFHRLRLGSRYSQSGRTGRIRC
jgi:hypothetical protein